MHIARWIPAALVLLVGSPSTGSGQVADTLPRSVAPLVVTGGLGLGTADVGWQLALALNLDRGHLVLRHSGSTEFTIFGPPDVTLRDFAALYGWIRRGGDGWLRAAVGPSLARVSRAGPETSCGFWGCGEDERTVSHAVGLAVQLDAVWAPFRILGIGPSIGANLNAEQSFATLVLALHVGGVR